MTNKPAYKPATVQDIEEFVARYPEHAGSASWYPAVDIETIELMRVMLAAWGVPSGNFHDVVPWRRTVERLFPERYISKWHILCAAHLEDIEAGAFNGPYYGLKWRPTADIMSRNGEFKAGAEFGLATGQPDMPVYLGKDTVGAAANRRSRATLMRTLAEQRGLPLQWPRPNRHPHRGR
jgi:hypothetical protein